jgi:hypothetical protein
MEILRKDENQNLIINKEQDFLNDLGWQENMIQFEDEVLSTIINPIENYETVRYIHKPYNTTVSGLTFSQTDIWYNFYFVSGTSYTQDYNVMGIDTHENAKMLKEATQSFFRLEFYKTPHISGTTYEPPTRVNRKLSFAKNLSLPLGEKYFYTGNNINEDIFFPVFMGSNYRNKENMYLFWFQDESVLSETVLSGDTFWMTAKFFNANDGTIIDFVNRPIFSNVEINEANDMYYKLVIDRTDYSYQYFRYTGTTGDRVGESIDSIKFYERKGIPLPTSTPTPTPTSTPTPTPTSTSTPTPTPTSTPTPTPTPTAGQSAPVSVTITGKYHGTTAPSDNLACNTGTDIQIVMNSTDFCTATTYNSSYFTSLGTGTFWISYNGKYRQIYHESSSQSATQSGNCNDCVGVTPTYYYYALGDCTQIKYAYTGVTSVGFGVGYIKVTGCNIFSEPEFDPLTSYYYDFNDPCGFTTGYTIGYVRSNVQLTEGDVYNYNNGCYSIVQLSEGFVPTSFIESSALGTKVTGSNACRSCQPPYTGFSQFYAFTGVVCGTSPAQETYVFSIAPYVSGNTFSLQLNTTYAVIEYDNLGNLTSDGYCVTVTGYSGAYSGKTVQVPMIGTYPVTYETKPVGPFAIGGGDITGCTDCQLYYNLTTVRCDGDLSDLVGYPIWSQQKLNVGDVVTTSLNDNVCRKVTEVWGHKFKPYKGFFQSAPVYVSGVFSGGTATVNCQSCTTAGGSGGNVGSTGNVTGTTTTMGNTTSLNEYCQNDVPYNAYSVDVTFTFNGSGGPVTPDTTVEYSVNGSTYTTWTPRSSTFTYTMYERDRRDCIDGTLERDNIRIKVNNILLINYTLGL